MHQRIRACKGAFGDRCGERRAGVLGMVREHEGRRVGGRVVTPPASPPLIRPCAADGAEHVPSQDEGTEAVHRAPRELVVDAGLAAALTLHLAEGARGEEPLEQLRAPLAERLIQALLRSRRVAIERHAEACGPCHPASSRHGRPSASSLDGLALYVIVRVAPTLRRRGGARRARWPSDASTVAGLRPQEDVPLEGIRSMAARRPASEECQPLVLREEALDMAVVADPHRVAALAQEHRELGDDRRVGRVGVVRPLEVSERSVRPVVTAVVGLGLERLANDVGQEDGHAARAEVRRGGVHGGPQVGGARHVHDGVVHEDGVERPAEAQRAQISRDARTRGSARGSAPASARRCR